MFGTSTIVLGLAVYAGLTVFLNVLDRKGYDI
jgi:hypothetical protein